MREEVILKTSDAGVLKAVWRRGAWWEVEERTAASGTTRVVRRLTTSAAIAGVELTYAVTLDDPDDHLQPAPDTVRRRLSTHSERLASHSVRLDKLEAQTGGTYCASEEDLSIMIHRVDKLETWRYPGYDELRRNLEAVELRLDRIATAADRS